MVKRPKIMLTHVNMVKRPKINKMFIPLIILILRNTCSCISHTHSGYNYGVSVCSSVECSFHNFSYLITFTFKLPNWTRIN
jgi:hypothetical protein